MARNISGRKLKGKILMKDSEYAKLRMKEASTLMSENTENGQLYEFHKGQFLAFREVIDSHYRKWSFKTKEEILLDNREKEKDYKD